MIIDKDYPGLILKNGLYYYDGSMKTEESIDIKIPISVSGSIESGGSITMAGIKTKSLFILLGTLRHNVWVMDTHIKIGCLMMEKSQWIEITESMAKDMGDDGSMWAIRDMLLKFC